MLANYTPNYVTSEATILLQMNCFKMLMMQGQQKLSLTFVTGSSWLKITPFSRTVAI